MSVARQSVAVVYDYTALQTVTSLSTFSPTHGPTTARATNISIVGLNIDCAHVVGSVDLVQPAWNASKPCDVFSCSNVLIKYE